MDAFQLEGILEKRDLQIDKLNEEISSLQIELTVQGEEIARLKEVQGKLFKNLKNAQEFYHDRS